MLVLQHFESGSPPMKILVVENCNQQHQKSKAQLKS